MRAATRTVERLDAAIALAQRLGYEVRLVRLSGESGGGCEIRGKKWLLLDLALTPAEHLEQVLATLRREAAMLAASAGRTQPESASLTASPELPV